MNLEDSQIHVIIDRGVKKSKSLLSLHMSGNNISIETYLFIRDTLGVIYEPKQENSNIEQCHQSFGQDVQYDEFKELKFNTFEKKNKLKVIEDIQKPIREPNNEDRFVFTRYLGTQEIVEGYKWK